MAGLVQGLIPKSPDADLDGSELDEHYHEQRRVFYVGLTRCTHVIVLSKYEVAGFRDAMRSGISVGGWAGRGIKRTLASEFMGELGPELPRPVSGASWKCE